MTRAATTQHTSSDEYQFAALFAALPEREQQEFLARMHQVSRVDKLLRDCQRAAVSEAFSPVAEAA